MKLLIDTDIGADVDDSLAIALALKLNLDIVGVTTVFKNTKERARLVKQLLLAYDENSKIKVYHGMGDTITKITNKQDKTMLYEDAINDEKFSSDNIGEDEEGAEAVEFIINMAKQYKEELVIVAIGPLTNIAKAIMLDKEAMQQVGKILIMGGNYFNNKHEWNVICDVEASKIVYESECNIYAVGTDVTSQTKLNYKQVDDILNNTNGKFNSIIARHAKCWLDLRKVGITLHDPLTLYLAVDESVVFFKKQKIFVETEGQLARGIIINMSATNLFNNSKLGKEVSCASDIHVDKFINNFMDIINS